MSCIPGATPDNANGRPCEQAVPANGICAKGTLTGTGADARCVETPELVTNPGGRIAWIVREEERDHLVGEPRRGSSRWRFQRQPRHSGRGCFFYRSARGAFCSPPWVWRWSSCGDRYQRRQSKSLRSAIETHIVTTLETIGYAGSQLYCKVAPIQACDISGRSRALTSLTRHDVERVPEGGAGMISYEWKSIAC